MGITRYARCDGLESTQEDEGYSSVKVCSDDRSLSTAGESFSNDVHMIDKKAIATTNNQPRGNKFEKIAPVAPIIVTNYHNNDCNRYDTTEEGIEARESVVTISKNETITDFKDVSAPETPPPIIIKDIEEATKLKENENAWIIESTGEQRRGSCAALDPESIISLVSFAESLQTSEAVFGGSDSTDLDVDILHHDIEEDELLKLVDKELEKTLKEEERRGKSTETIKQKRLSALIVDEATAVDFQNEVVTGRRRTSLGKFKAIASMFS